MERRGLPPPWAEAVAELRRQAARVPESECVTATVIVEAAEGVARVVVATGDGRQAERFVARPDALYAVAFGLLATIPSEGLDVHDDVHDDVAPPREAPPVVLPPPPSPDAPGRRRATGFGVTPGIGLRFGAPTAVVMGEAKAEVELHASGWLVIASARYGVAVGRTTQSAAPDWTYEETAVALGPGLRLPWGRVNVEATIAPEIVFATDRLSESGRGGEATAFRVHALGRLAWPLSETVDLAVDLDGELTPIAPRIVDDALPRVATWTLGFGTGAVWDLR